MAESIPVTDYKDLGRLRTKRPQNRNSAYSKLRKINALDTETRHGDIFLIADSDGLFLDNITPESVIQFLFSKKYQNTWNFFYNLAYDAEVILKLLDQELFRYNLSRKLEFHWNDFKLEYIPSKLLRIKKGHHSVLFFDIAQFFGKSLAAAYEENIESLPEEYLSLKTKRAEFSKWFYSHNKKKIRNYCIQDCILTKKLAEHWISLFHNAFSFYPAKWPSSGYLAEKVLINNDVFFPKFDSIPYSIQDLAFRSYFGGRFEMIKRGFVGKSYLYDINSAYPYAISQLPDLDNGKWVKRKSIHEKAKLGFFKILADIPDDEIIPPFAFRANQNILFPSGKFITYCTLAELQACRDDSQYRILEGYQFVPNNTIKPYCKFIESLYEKRIKLKNENNPLEKPFKIILNSIYGKTGQKVNRIIGNLFNPVIFASITGHTRAQLYRFITENNLEKQTIAFATDSICVTKKLNINSKKLGEFSFDGAANDTFYLQNGFYRFNGVWKQRGFGKLGSKEIEHLETFEKDDKLFYKIAIKRNTRLRSGIIQNNIKDIGKIMTITKKVNLNADRKRLWLGKINDINQKQYNNSMPISLNHFTKEQI
ncbi:DNA polymerase [Nitrosopumilus adriaticus]|uniref:DNA-directed DNA polymerase n=1 Tax=Nitrosopumilus adriaticus TaxID=1580092 RepID=A0A0D5C2M4_9ARCH|nr:DNA polymerase [Nitrosopumilus adriaticus]AJW71054.1 Type B DNA polymerase [Nitrosopumilus adriaticus]